MAGLLGDIYSYGDTLKRKVNGLLADPRGTLEQFVGQLGDQANQTSDLMNQAGWMPIAKTNATKEQQAMARALLAEQGANTATAGMFVGKGSKTWNGANAQKAEQLAAQGVDQRKVWSETGTWKGPDGMWRQEIPDNAAKFKEVPRENISNRMPVGRAVKHDALFDAYPEAWDAKVQFTDGPGGSFRSNGLIEVGTQDAPYPIGATAHELQHAIQQREGFARGGSPSGPYQAGERSKLIDDLSAKLSSTEVDLSNPYSAGAYVPSLQEARIQAERYIDSPEGRMEAYRRLAGEAEARATQTRIPLTAEQRLATFPEDSYDVPMNQLIIRGLLGN